MSDDGLIRNDMDVGDRLLFVGSTVLFFVTGALLQALATKRDETLGGMLFGPLARLCRRRRAPPVEEATPMRELSADWPQVTAVELFLKAAQERPSKLALAGAMELSYAALAQHVEGLAKDLRGRGLKKGDKVVLSLDRGVAQVVAVYGVMRAGGCWVPVDASAPPERLRLVCADVQAAFVLATGPRDVDPPVLELDQCGRLYEGGPEGSLQDVKVTLDDPAFVIYTSGSSGKPKGVQYSHRFLAHGSWFFAAECQMDASSVCLLKAPYFWAVIEYELFPALSRGATLVVAPPNAQKDPAIMVKLMKEHQVTCLLITALVLDFLVDLHQQQGGLGSLKAIVNCGEAMPSTVADKTVRALPGCELINLYGATEASCASWHVPRTGVPDYAGKYCPAGRPQPDVGMHILDANLEPVPAGEPGEIVCSGVMADGYVGDPAKTQASFPTHPQYGRIYRTGDRGRLVNGDIVVVGRIDRQVKIRGVRIEPEEVEACIRDFQPASPAPSADRSAGQPLFSAPGIASCSVVATASEPKELCAFVEPKLDEAQTAALKQHLRARLPAYFVPQHVFPLDALPRLGNGKVDLKQLERQATLLAETSTEVVLDSLGRMRQMSKAAILENQVIHKCYAFWMIGVMIDHWTVCALGPFAGCAMMFGNGVPKWAELFVRSIGNDQDMFGFLMLGALQDSQLKPGETRPRVKLGIVPDLFLFLVYLGLAWPFPQLFHALFPGWVPVEDMLANDDISGHRWYLLMLLEARLCIAVWQALRVPPPVQLLIHVCICIFIPSTNFNSALDPCCVSMDAETGACGEARAEGAWRWLFAWVFGGAAPGWGTCPVLVRWVQWYLLFYIFAFHYVRFVLDWAKPRLPSTPVWGWLAFAASFFIATGMAAFHYPNTVMETGDHLENAPLEFAANMLQPAFLALGMVWFPFNLAWWGNTTLGTYCFHFYFLHQMIEWSSKNMPHIAEIDPSGILCILYVIGTAAVFSTFLGPFCHYILIGPTILYGKYAARRRQNRLANAS